jgi:hypothetical protein
MMNKLLQKLSIIILFPSLLFSCIDSGYNMDDLDDSGGFTPALVLPIGTLKTSIMDLITEAGIPKNLLEINDNTIYIVYKNSMSLDPESPVPGFYGDVIYSIPEGIKFTLAHGEESIDIDVFETLASSGSVFYPADPQIRLDIKNYIGANIDIDVNGITSYSSDGRHSTAMFGNANSYKIHVEGAPAPHEYTAHSETFNKDKDKGSLHELFAIAPNSLSYDLSVDLAVPDDGKQHFIVNGKYVDLDYELRLPMTFGEGTRLASADTIDLDLSGEDFVSALDELTLWIDYENGIPATAGLDILFLDEYKQAIPELDRRFRMNADALSTLKLQFNSNEFDAAQNVRYVVLKTILKVDDSEVSIHPSDDIKLKLSAYFKVNI